MEEKELKIVTNDSEGYGYKYASLGDIAKQGYKIPLMKTATEGEKEYLYFYEPTLKEWLRGAEVVIPKSNGMNAAQLYGAALTYARRYTTQMADCIACDDDKDVEDLKADGDKKKPIPATKSQIEKIKNLYNEENQAKIITYYKVKSLEDLTLDQAKEAIGKKAK